MINATVQLAYKSSAWFTANAATVLAAGRVVFLSGTRTFKVGDGVTALSSLPFYDCSGGTGNFVPYTGATADVDLDTFSLNAKSLNVKGTNGNGSIGLKHQAANITANGNESGFGADVSGNPVWKNDGNPLQYFLLKDAAQIADIVGLQNSLNTIFARPVTQGVQDNIVTFDRDGNANDSGSAITLVTGAAQKSANLSDLASAATARTNLGLGTLATQSGTFSGTSSGTNTGDQTSIVGITGTKTEFNTACTNGDFVYTDNAALTDPRNQKHYGSTTQALCVSTATNEVLYAVALPAMQTTDIFEFIVQLRCTSSANSKIYTAWLNTAANLSGSPTQIATVTSTTNAAAAAFQRRFAVRTSTTIQSAIAAATSFLNPYANTTVLPTTITVPDLTLGNLYLVIACNRANSGDTAGAEFVKPIIYRA